MGLLEAVSLHKLLDLIFVGFLHLVPDIVAIFFPYDVGLFIHLVGLEGVEIGVKRFKGFLRPSEEEILVFWS